ncbi:MAG: SO2930 family diheme c-type cytochrome [Isosphaeraceae bacterium]
MTTPHSRAHRRPIRAFPPTAVAALLLGISACSQHATHEPAPPPGRPFERLSQYGVFAGDPTAQSPAAGVIPYDLNSPLFADYSAKYRFIKLPPGTPAVYREDDVFAFPIGTVIAKTFAYPHDARDPSRGRRLIETRILKHDADGWVGLPYIWNAAQTDAILDVAGDTLDVTWIHTDGRRRTNNYIIPNVNQCKGCHKASETMLPIGPKARHLNRDFVYAEGPENQLDHWARNGALAGAPAPAAAPRLAVWDDEKSGTLDARARAWLEINCAHCHSPSGPARNSGLDLLASQQNPTAFGIFKPPVAAGLGSGGLQYDIVPGKPDQSILAHRIASTHPGVMMPELGKRLVDEEGVALIRAWISAMADAGPQPRRVGARAAERGTQFYD